MATMEVDGIEAQLLAEFAELDTGDRARMVHLARAMADGRLHLTKHQATGMTRAEIVRLADMLAL